MKKMIKWTDDESEKVILQLQRDLPYMSVVTAKSMLDFAGMTQKNVIAAQQTALPPERQRPVHTVFDIKPALLKAAKTLQENKPDLVNTIKLELAQTPPDVAAVISEKRKYTPTKGVSPPHFDAKTLAALPKVFWNDKEYDDMVAYLKRHYPTLTRDVQAAKKIMPKHIREAAEKVLPAHRQRANVQTLSPNVREGLEMAVERLVAARAERARIREEEKARVEAAALEAEQQRQEAIREIEERLQKEQQEKEQVIAQVENTMSFTPDPCTQSEPTQRPLDVALGQAETALDELAWRVAPTPEPALPTLDELTSEFAAHLADRFALAFVDALIPRMKMAFSSHLAGALADIVTRPSLTPAPAPVPKHNPAPAPSNTPRLPKLCIIGLLKPNHVQEVKDSFSSKFDLRFAHPDESVHVMKDRSRHADKTLLLTEQISHKHKYALEAEHIAFTPVTGSIGRLKEYLSTLDVHA